MKSDKIIVSRTEPRTSVLTQILSYIIISRFILIAVLENWGTIIWILHRLEFLCIFWRIVVIKEPFFPFALLVLHSHSKPCKSIVEFILKFFGSSCWEIKLVFVHNIVATGSFILSIHWKHWSQCILAVVVYCRKVGFCLSNFSFFLQRFALWV